MNSNEVVSVGVISPDGQRHGHSGSEWIWNVAAGTINSVGGRFRPTDTTRKAYQKNMYWSREEALTSRRKEPDALGKLHSAPLVGYDRVK